MPMTPQSLALLKKNAQDVYVQELDKIGDFVSVAVNKKQSADQIETTYAHIGSFGTAPRISDGSLVPLDEMTRLHRKSFNGVNNLRAKGFATTYLGKKIDPFKIMKKAGPEMMAAHAQTRNALAAAFHAQGFNTTTWGPDGVAENFYSATHVGGPTGGTAYSNLVTAQAPSWAGLTEAQTVISRQRTNRNMVIAKPNRLTMIVPYELEVITAQLIESTGQADSMDRADNKVIGKRYSYAVNPFATSATQWFVKGEGDHLDNGVIWMQFCDLDLYETALDQRIMSAILTAECYDLGWVSGRGWAGCAGA